MSKFGAKVLPSDAYKGPRGGMKRTSRLAGLDLEELSSLNYFLIKDRDDPRRHIIWVLMHGKLFKCSVHSVRPVTAVERFHHDVHSKEDVTKMKTLSDLVPEREFVDITDEVPDPDEPELQILPPKP